MISLKRNIYRFLVGLLIFGLFPLSSSAQKITDDDAIVVEITRPDSDYAEDDKSDTDDSDYTEDDVPKTNEPGHIEDDKSDTDDSDYTEEDVPKTNEPGHIEDDKSDTDDSVHIEDDAPETDEMVRIEDDASSDGDPLPGTATSMYNYLAIGVLLLVIGSGLYIIQRKGD